MDSKELTFLTCCHPFCVYANIYNIHPLFILRNKQWIWHHDNRCMQTVDPPPPSCVCTKWMTPHDNVCSLEQKSSYLTDSQLYSGNFFNNNKCLDYTGFSPWLLNRTNVVSDIFYSPWMPYDLTHQGGGGLQQFSSQKLNCSWPAYSLPTGHIKLI